jgi:hypothetical protein
LRKNLARRVVIVGQPVVVIRVLIAVKEAFRLTFMNAVTFAKRFIVTLDRIRLDERCAMSLDAHLSLLARVARARQSDRHVHHGAEHRVRDSGIP